MDDSSPPPNGELVTHLETGARGEAIARLEEVREATAEDRKATLRSLRGLAGERPELVEPVCSALAEFLEDDERPVRLTTAKLFVALAEATPEVVVPAVGSLADRLADADEFYYVRARSAEALGYVALEHPGAVEDPGILADLRVGLSFDEPAVKEKLAKALEYVALGDPGRLRHQVSSLADHLDDDSVLVRYHLSTALVAIGCAHPGRLAPAGEVLVGLLDDENARVRGRGAEALGLLAGDGAVDGPREQLAEMAETEDETFVVERVRFALDATGESHASTDLPESVGTLDGVRTTTPEAVDAITSPDGDGVCPHCGLDLPGGGPPMCPRCGAPLQTD